MEILFFLVCFIVGYFLGMRRTIKLFENGDLVLEPVEDMKFYDPRTGEETFPNKHILIDIEAEDDTIFVYNTETGKYMAHGKTHQEVEAILKERFPGVTFGISEETMKWMNSL